MTMPSVRMDRGLFLTEVSIVGIREEARRIHGCGYNCAQSVFCACGKYTGLDDKSSLAISAGFGGGVRSGEICGAISGAVMALGYLKAHEDPSAPAVKQEVAALARDCVDSFRGQYGCVRCEELKQAGVNCGELIEFCAQYVEDQIK